MKKKHKVYGAKKFLNHDGHHTIAAIGYSVAMETYPGAAYTSGSLWVSDCNRQITLDLSWADKDSLENTLHKLETGRDMFDQAIQDVIKLNKEYLAEKQKIKARLKKEKKKKTS